RYLYSQISASRNIGRATPNVSAARSDNSRSGAQVFPAGKKKLFIMRYLPQSKMPAPQPGSGTIVAGLQSASLALSLPLLARKMHKTVALSRLAAARVRRSVRNISIPVELLQLRLLP